ncbi:MAG: PEP-CTERM sorting domain-containing protein [Acidobacteria bacterium]|nr:PEP-CTERM sorting domain-containing protein [Acidobacteriota bacterium]
MNFVQRFVVFSLVAACPGTGAVIDPYYAGSYSFVNLGTPSGVPSPLGGLTINPNNTSSLLIGGGANAVSGTIEQISVTRDGSGHITGFSGSSSVFASAPSIDGGLAFSLDDVLFYTTYSNHTIQQIKPGDISSSKSINAITLGIGSSLGTLQFVPAGYPGAGKLALASYSSGQFCLVDLTADGAGTYDLSTCGTITNIGGGPEGILYVPLGSALFTNPSILVSEYSLGRVSSYELDANGNPILATRRTFISGLSGAEGATLDPVTNDFLFSTFGSGNEVLRVSGFAEPPTGDVPEPSTLFLSTVALGALAWIRRR